MLPNRLQRSVTRHHVRAASAPLHYALAAHYRVTTRINFYAVPAATILGQDFIATILSLYKDRSERAERENHVAADLDHAVAQQAAAGVAPQAARPRARR